MFTTLTHDPAKVLEAYRLHRIEFGGGDRDFIQSKALDPMPSEAWLRKHLRLWRGRAAAGLDPLTGEASETAKALLDQLGTPDALFQAAALKQAEERALELQAKATLQAANGTDGKAAELQPQDKDARRLRKAQRVMDRLLDGKPVSPLVHKMAVAVLEAAGKLGKPRNADKVGKVSEFTTWPTAALQGLLQDLGATALSTRHDPAPPAVVVPTEEQDAARTDEGPAALPA